MFLAGTTPLKKEMLNTEKCYMLDCSAEIFIWMGRNTSLTERKMSISVTEVRNVYASICYMYFLALSKVYVFVPVCVLSVGVRTMGVHSFIFSGSCADIELDDCVCFS